MSLKFTKIFRRNGKRYETKIAIIASFMHKPKVLILDEPTSDLDPLIQQKFTKLLMNCKKEKSTIFMSSHIFGEIENTCGKVGIIKNRKVISKIVIAELKNTFQKNNEIKFNRTEAYNTFIKNKNEILLKKIIMTKS